MVCGFGGKKHAQNSRDDFLEMHETSTFSLRTLPVGVANEVEDMHPIRSDHDEGIWENIGLIKPLF